MYFGGNIFSPQLPRLSETFWVFLTKISYNGVINTADELSVGQPSISKKVNSWEAKLSIDNQQTILMKGNLFTLS